LLTILEPAANRKYVIGVDTAGGGSTGDYCCAQVVDTKSGLHCAELHGRWTPPEFAEELYKLGRRYHDAQLVIERNNHGHAVICLLEKRNYPALYQDDRGNIGLLNTTATRPRMLAELAAVLIESPWRFASRALLNEMRTFVRNMDGKPEAAGGSHDDRVMAMALCMAH
jgi:hypothetical protein